MAANIRVKLNRGAARQLLRSQGAESFARERCLRVARNAGPGMEVDSQIGRNRARAAVITGTIEARINQAKHRALSRAIDAAR